MSTDPSEFERYHEQLMAGAPQGFVPHYFPVQRRDKAPGVPRGINWKTEEARLTPDEAYARLKNGENVGIGALEDDTLVHVDVDTPEYTDQLKDGLHVTSRSRICRHGTYFAGEEIDMPNIVTDDEGEVRCDGQYVVAPGSFVPVTDEDLVEIEEEHGTEMREQVENDPQAGLYTVACEDEATTLTGIDELPHPHRQAFLDSLMAEAEEEEQNSSLNDFSDGDDDSEHDRSAFFDLTLRDVVPASVANAGTSDRVSASKIDGLHGSSTDSNVSHNGDTLACWRHLVTHGPQQLLAVKSGHLSCKNAGKGHSNGSAGPSRYKGDDEALFHAWKEAQESDLLPDDDREPRRVLCHLARAHDLCDSEAVPARGSDDMLPIAAYNAALDVLEEDYGITPVRDPLTERSDDNDGLPKPSDFKVKEGRYGYYTEHEDRDGDRSYKWHEGTTFQLETRSFIIEDDGATVTVELTVHPASDEPPYDVTVPIDVFTEPRKFRQKVATGRTTTYDLGTSFLNKIRRFVGGQDAPIRTPSRQIGLHDGEFVTPDGVLTAAGWSDDPDTILVDNDTTVPQKWALDPEDGIDYDRDAVVNILETLPRTRESERFLPVLGWFYAAALRPLIMEWSGEFNILNITGDTGAGKTATISMLWQLFGMDGEPLSTTGTAFTRLTAFSSSNAVPVWFDEFKPAEMSDYQLDTFLALLRKSTRGGTEPKGNADQTEDQWHLRAPTVVTGEQLVSGPAEERRSIQTVFTSAVTDEDREEFRHFARLSGGYYVDDNGETIYCDEPNLADHARAYYTWLLNRIEDDADTLEQEWHRAGERVTTLLAGADMSVHPTVKQGFQTILFGCWLYRGLCDEIGADAEAAGVTDANVLDAIMTTAETGTGSEHVSHLDRLLGLAARAAAADYLEEGEHYKLVVPQDGTDDDEELRLKLSTAFDEIRRYARDHDVQDGDLLDAAHDYRIRIQDAEGETSSVVVSSSVKTYGLNRTCAFSVTTASTHIEDFERAMFTDEENPAGDGDGDGETTIDDLVPGQYVTIEAMAASVLDPAPWLDGEGTFSDDSGRIDYVVRGPVETEIEQGVMHRLENVKVTTDDDGMTILEIRGGTTGVVPIGATASEQHDVVETAETDGGSVDGKDDVEPTAVQAVTRAVDNDGDEIRFAELRATVSANHDIAPDTVGNAIERAVEQGRIIDAGGGRYQPS